MAATFLILVGSFTSYISAIRFNPSASSLTYVTQTAVGSGPSWLTLHPSNSSIVYATEDQWYTSGNIHSLILDPSTGALTRKNTVSTQTSANQGGAVYIEPLNGGTELAVANYNSGSAFIVGLGSDKLSFTSTQLMKFTGTGPLPNQNTQHPHQVGEILFCYHLANSRLIDPYSTSL